MNRLIIVRNVFRIILLTFLIISLFIPKDLNCIIFNMVYSMLSIGLLGVIITEIILFIKKKT